MTLSFFARAAAGLAAAALLVAPAAAATAAPPLAVRAILEQPVEVHGSLNYDAAGNNGGPILYPVVNGAGLGGLLVAVATHAVMSSGAQSAEKKRMREQADLFLEPHRPALDGYRMGDLLNEALPLLTSAAVRRVVPASSAITPGEAVVDSTPTFYLTQDGRALVLENVVLLRASALAEPLQRAVRVVAPARAAEGALASWFDQGAARLRETGAQMFARSLDLAINDLRAAPTTPGAFKTVRYPEGGLARMERAQVLSSTCESLVLRTLRGGLMAVPREYDDEEPEPGCNAPAPLTPAAAAAQVPPAPSAPAPGTGAVAHNR